MKMTGNNKVAAALINFFEQWHNHKLKNKPQAQAANEQAVRHGDEPTQDTSLMVWATEGEIKEALLGIASGPTIRKAIELLKELKVITVHRNPNPRYKFDNTNHYLFQVDQVKAWLYNNYDYGPYSDPIVVADPPEKSFHIDPKKVSDGPKELSNDAKKVSEQYHRTLTKNTVIDTKEETNLNNNTDSADLAQAKSTAHGSTDKDLSEDDRGNEKPLTSPSPTPQPTLTSSPIDLKKSPTPAPGGRCLNIDYWVKEILEWYNCLKEMNRFQQFRRASATAKIRAMVKDQVIPSGYTLEEVLGAITSQYHETVYTKAWTYFRLETILQCTKHKDNLSRIIDRAYGLGFLIPDDEPVHDPSSLPEISGAAFKTKEGTESNFLNSVLEEHSRAGSHETFIRAARTGDLSKDDLLAIETSSTQETVLKWLSRLPANAHPAEWMRKKAYISTVEPSDTAFYGISKDADFNSKL